MSNARPATNLSVLHNRVSRVQRMVDLTPSSARNTEAFEMLLEQLVQARRALEAAQEAARDANATRTVAAAASTGRAAAVLAERAALAAHRANPTPATEAAWHVAMDRLLTAR